MPNSNWRSDLESSNMVMLILGADFYESTGIDTLNYAIKLQKPIILITVEGRDIPIPEEYVNYQGPKKQVEVEEPFTEKSREAITQAVVEFGVNLESLLSAYSYEWQDRRT